MEGEEEEEEEAEQLLLQETRFQREKGEEEEPKELNSMVLLLNVFSTGNWRQILRHGVIKKDEISKTLRITTERKRQKYLSV